MLPIGLKYTSDIRCLPWLLWADPTRLS